MARRQRLAQRRKAVGLSQERLAEIMGVDRSTIVRWERADTDPQPWNRPRLARALRITFEGLANLLAEGATPADDESERLDAALREPTRVDRATAETLRVRVQHLDERYDSSPSAALLAQTGQLHGQVLLFRRHAVDPGSRRRLMAAEALSATLMGQLVWDASQRREHAAAIEFFDQAIQVAKHTGDTAAEAHAMLRKSYVALYGTQNLPVALALASQVAAVGAPISTVLAGLGMLHVAEAQARLGRLTECERALGSASTHFAAVSPDDPALPLYCPSQHPRLAGSCWLSLAQPGRARTALGAAQRAQYAVNKSGAIVLGNLALASIRLREIDAATQYLHQALDVIERTRSSGGFTVVGTAVRELRPWRQEASVREVNDRILALMTTGPEAHDVDR